MGIEDSSKPFGQRQKGSDFIPCIQELVTAITVKKNSQQNHFKLTKNRYLVKYQAFIFLSIIIRWILKETMVLIREEFLQEVCPACGFPKKKNTPKLLRNSKIFERIPQMKSLAWDLRLYLAAT